MAYVSQSATLLMGGIMSLPNTNCPRIFNFIMWYVDCTAKSAAARIPINGSASSTYVSCGFYVCTRFPNTWCILSMVAFSFGLPGEAGLVLIPYSFSIKLFLNSWLRNSLPRSYVISTGRGYRTSHVVYIKFSVVIAFLSLYCVTSNHPVMGSIILTAFNIILYLPFLRIL